MIIEEIKAIKGGIKDFRRFGITIGIVLSLWGVLLFWRGKTYYAYFFIASLAFLFSGLALPALLKPVYKTWMALAKILSWIITLLILSILFYILITPLGLLQRLFRKTRLDVNFKEKKDSYWIKRQDIKFDKKDYEYQF